MPLRLLLGLVIVVLPERQALAIVAPRMRNGRAHYAALLPRYRRAPIVRGGQPVDADG
jgi:hypothetical protein